MEPLLVCFLQVMIFVFIVGSLLGDRRHDISCSVFPFTDKKLRATFLGKDTFFNGICSEESDQYSRQLPVYFSGSPMSSDFVASQEKFKTSKGDTHLHTTASTKPQSKKQRNNKKLKGSKRQRKKNKKKLSVKKARKS